MILETEKGGPEIEKQIGKLNPKGRLFARDVGRGGGFGSIWEHLIIFASMCEHLEVFAISWRHVGAVRSIWGHDYIH